MHHHGTLERSQMLVVAVLVGVTWFASTPADAAATAHEDFTRPLGGELDGAAILTVHDDRSVLHLTTTDHSSSQYTAKVHIPEEITTSRITMVVSGRMYAPDRLVVVVSGDNETRHEVVVRDLDEPGWTTVSIDVAAFSGHMRTVMRVELSGPSGGSSVFIDAWTLDGTTTTTQATIAAPGAPPFLVTYAMLGALGVAVAAVGILARRKPGNLDSVTRQLSAVQSAVREQTAAFTDNVGRIEKVLAEFDHELGNATQIFRLLRERVDELEDGS